MATGISDSGINAFKLVLLDYTESINHLKERLDNCKVSISYSVNGTGKSEIISKLDGIIYQMQSVNKNINDYISSISKVFRFYEEQDLELKSQISKDIDKIDGLKEEMKDANY